MQTFRKIIPNPRDDEDRISNLAAFIEHETNKGKIHLLLTNFLKKAVNSKWLTFKQTTKPMHKFDYPGFDIILNKTIPVPTTVMSSRGNKTKEASEKSWVEFLELQDWCHAITADDKPKAVNDAPIIAGGVDMSTQIKATQDAGAVDINALVKEAAIAATEKLTEKIHDTRTLKAELDAQHSKELENTRAQYAAELTKRDEQRRQAELAAREAAVKAAFLEEQHAILLKEKEEQRLKAEAALAEAEKARAEALAQAKPPIAAVVQEVVQALESKNAGKRKHPEEEGEGGGFNWSDLNERYNPMHHVRRMWFPPKKDN